ncbi:MAG: molecular chaperone TorD family protein [Coriobacteriaceae bacterium]|jgi:TorA maturation chaperone TorD|nr:molecular chaperone TorD family protein [Coriobacteriaceae bacterium]
MTEIQGYDAGLTAEAGLTADEAVGSKGAPAEASQGKPLGQPGNAEADIAELVEVLKKRSDTYALLSRLYRQEIDQELLDEMHGMLYPAEDIDEHIYNGNLFIATYLSNLWSGSLDDLRVDFARCFLGHGVDGFSAAYPYESVYTSEKRLMMQVARDEVLAVYRAYGITKTNEWKEGEDHLSLELEFMRILNERAIQAFLDGELEKAEGLLTAQLGFQESHLLPWVPMLVADMKRFAQTKMYLGLADLTLGFLRTDSQFLADLFSDQQEPDALDAGTKVEG